MRTPLNKEFNKKIESMFNSVIESKKAKDKILEEYSNQSAAIFSILDSIEYGEIDTTDSAMSELSRLLKEEGDE